MTFKSVNEKRPFKEERGSRPGLLLGREALAGICAAVAVLASVVGASVLVWPQDSPEAVQTMESKIRALTGPVPAGTKSLPPIVVTEEEANAYLKNHGHEFLPPGVRDTALHITPERVFGSANVDFSTMSQATANTKDWGPKVLAAMFKGPQRIAAAGRVDAQNGQARVKIETVVVGTSTVPQWLIDLLLENYVGPRYKLDMSKPIPLANHIERIELGNGRATFIRSPGK